KDLSLGKARALIGALRPLEDCRPQTVPRAAFRTVPVPADAVEPAVLALIAPAGIADACQQRTERSGVGDRLHAGSELRGDSRQARDLARRHGGREQPRELPRRDAPALPQAPGEPGHDAGARPRAAAW